jgi:hypothetical protein
MDPDLDATDIAVSVKKAWITLAMEGPHSAKFPVNFPISREFSAETGSKLTASYSNPRGSDLINWRMLEDSSSPSANVPSSKFLRPFHACKTPPEPAVADLTAMRRKGLSSFLAVRPFPKLWTPRPLVHNL